MNLSLNTAEGTLKGIHTGGNYGSTNNFFPASGYRFDDGDLHSTFLGGMYWTGSVSALEAKGCALFFSFNNLIVTSAQSRESGLPVRCIID
jgi:hypothetical protein